MGWNELGGWPTDSPSSTPKPPKVTTPTLTTVEPCTTVSMTNSHNVKTTRNAGSMVLPDGIFFGKDHCESTRRPPMLRDEGLPGHTNTPTRQASLTTTRNLATLRAHVQDTHIQADTQLWHQLRVELYDDRASEFLQADWQRQRTESFGLLHSTDWLQSATFQLHGTLAARQDRYRSEDLNVRTSATGPHRTNASLALASTWWPAAERVLFYPAVHVQLLRSQRETSRPTAHRTSPSRRSVDAHRSPDNYDKFRRLHAAARLLRVVWRPW